MFIGFTQQLKQWLEKDSLYSGQKRTAWGGNVAGGCHMSLRHLANLKTIISWSDSVDEQGLHQ